MASKDKTGKAAGAKSARAAGKSAKDSAGGIESGVRKNPILKAKVPDKGGKFAASVAKAAAVPVAQVDPGRLPLFTLLSFVLVAFTIESDNAFEQRMAHWTSDYGGVSRREGGVWLTSMAMYLNCLKHVGDDGVRVGELERLARTHANLHGMERWGYVTIAPDPADTRAKVPQRDWIIRTTRAGKKAREIWAALLPEIERRWEQRFGAGEIRELREALHEIASRIGGEWPECMPILVYGLTHARMENLRTGAAAAAAPAPPPHELELYVLLARVLLAFAVEFDTRSKGSIAIGANVLRVLTEDGVALRDLTVLSGVSKESIAIALGLLRKYGIVDEIKNPVKTGKLVRLTPKGVELRERAMKLVESLEHEWHQRFGHDAMRRLRVALETIVRAEGAEADENGNASLLFAGMKPHAEGWRARVKTPRTLPHFPMVSHRGGYPDGS
jgi:DNA-binding MarR family transcriptional regulator